MNEHTLNRLTAIQLAELALKSATFLTSVRRPMTKMELYYIDRHFIEVSYSLDAFMKKPAVWKLYSANHFPDGPESTKYLTMYLQQIKLSID